MNITTSQLPVVKTERYKATAKTGGASPSASAEAAIPQETFTFSRGQTSTAVKIGKYALATAATAGAGTLAYYAGTNVGTAATVAGVAGGALAGIGAGGFVGLMKDISSGFGGSSSNATLIGAAGGGITGGLVGGLVGAQAQSGFAGTCLGIVAGASAFAISAASTNLLAK